MKTSEQIQLWNSFVNGNSDAFLKIHNTYREYLYNFAFNIVKCSDLTKDVLQDVFTKIYQKGLEKYVIKSSLKSLLVRTTINTAFDTLKARRNSYCYNNMSEIVKNTICNEALSHIAMEELLTFTNNNFTATQNKVLLMKMNGYSLKEMAEKNGSKVSTIKSHIKSINKSLRKIKNFVI